jgi:glycosyltransferase involved in cell wall biosynthesis
MAEHADALARTYADVLARRRTPPQISVIIRSADRQNDLLASIAALAETAPDGVFELIVVDEGSRDGTRELLASIEGDLRVITREVPGGAAVALMDAARAAQAPTVIAMRVGTRLRPGWLDRALADGMALRGVDASGEDSGRPDAVVGPAHALREETCALHVASVIGA